MATEFKPVKLTRAGRNRTARSAAEEAELRFDGWHSPKQKQPGDKTETNAKATPPAEASPKKS